MQVFNVVPTFLEVSLVAGILAYKCGPAFAALTAGTITLYSLVTFAITSVCPPTTLCCILYKQSISCVAMAFLCALCGQSIVLWPLFVALVGVMPGLLNNIHVYRISTSIHQTCLHRVACF